MLLIVKTVRLIRGHQIEHSSELSVLEDFRDQLLDRFWLKKSKVENRN